MQIFCHGSARQIGTFQFPFPVRFSARFSSRLLSFLLFLSSLFRTGQWHGNPRSCWLLGVSRSVPIIPFQVPFYTTGSIAGSFLFSFSFFFLSGKETGKTKKAS